MGDEQTPNSGEGELEEQGNWFANPEDCAGWAEQAAQGHTRCCYPGEGPREGQAVGVDMEGPGPC